MTIQVQAQESQLRAPEIFRFEWGIGDQVWIVHFGSKSTPLIAQQLREIGLRSRVINAEDFSAAWARRPSELKLVILSGGDKSVFDDGAPTLLPEVFREMRASGIHVLGICYGAQLLAQLCGGEVKRAATAEYNVHAHLTCTGVTHFGHYRGGRVVMNHRDEITSLPEGWVTYGSTEHCTHAFVGGGNLFAI